MKFSIEMDTAQPMRSDQIEALVALVRSMGEVRDAQLPTQHEITEKVRAECEIENKPGTFYPQPGVEGMSTDDDAVEFVPVGPTEFVLSSGQTGVMDDTPNIDTAVVFGAQPLEVINGAGEVGTLGAGTGTVTPITMPEKDSQGVVWDQRIHASTKTQTKVGQWTRRKGVDDAVFAQVMGELTAAAIGAPLTVAPPPPPPAASGPMTFPEFVTKATAKGIKAETIVAECQKHGVASVPLLATARPDLIPTVAAALGVV